MATVDRVLVLPEPWLVPAALADFECQHGRLPGECPTCDAVTPSSENDRSSA